MTQAQGEVKEGIDSPQCQEWTNEAIVASKFCVNLGQLRIEADGISAVQLTEMFVKNFPDLVDIMKTKDFIEVLKTIGPGIKYFINLWTTSPAPATGETVPGD